MITIIIPNSNIKSEIQFFISHKTNVSFPIAAGKSICIMTNDNQDMNKNQYSDVPLNFS